MTLAIAPTDLDWFQQVRQEAAGMTVNFWTPTPWNVRGLRAKDRLYFLLKRPIRRIGGFGRFVDYSNMTAREAWTRFGRANGTDSLSDLVGRIDKYASKNAKGYLPTKDPIIGCIVLTGAVFLDDGDFVDPNECGFKFPREVVKLKYFPDADAIPGVRSGLDTRGDFSLVDPTEKRKRVAEITARAGQAIFRAVVLAAYGDRCAITGESCASVLEAAHIQPYVNETSHHVQNGLCLRVDLHRLFDDGLLTITSEFTIQASSRLQGTSYAELDGRSLNLPLHKDDHPSPMALDFHRQSVFR